MGSTVRRSLLAGVLFAVVLVGVLVATHVAPGRAATPVDQQAAAGPVGSGVTGAVEVRRLWTARSRTWVRPDGLRRTRIYEQPVNYRSSTDGWQPIDDRLQHDSGAWINGANSYHVSIPSSLGSGPLRVEHRSDWLTLQLHGADVPANVDGASASFEGARRGVTAQWTARAQSLKEDLILADADAASSFAFDVALSGGLRLVNDENGGITAVGADGRVAFVLAPPSATDAAGATSPAGTLQMRAERDGDAWMVHLDVAADWLRAPDRSFPVTVDPSVYPEPTDCQLDEGNPTASDCTSGTIAVGHSGSPLKDHRALLQFDIDAAVPREANVMSAFVWAYAVSKAGTSTAPLRAYRVTSPWTTDATWNKRNATTNWTSAGADVVTDPEYTSDAPVLNHWTGWTVTDLARAWLDGSVANDGILLRDAGSNSVNAVNFVSSDSTDYHHPVLEVDYFTRTGSMLDYTLDSQQLSARQQLAVNVAGGNLLLSSTDLKIAGRGMDLSVQRFSNSGDDWSGQMGFGGRLSIGSDIHLIRCDDSGAMCFYGPSGYHARFNKNSDGSYTLPPSIDATLVRHTDGSYTLTFTHTGVRYEFFAGDDPFLTDIVDPNGNTIHFDYTSSRLSQITDTQGRQTAVTRNSSGFITKIQDPTGRHWDYAYDTSGDLTSVTDPNGNATGYHYDSSQRVDVITDARSNTTDITYDSSNRVTSVKRVVDGTTTNDVTTTYAYSSASSPCNSSTDVGKTVVTDPRGHDTTYCWNANGQVTLTQDALGRQSTQSYTSMADPAEVTSYADTAHPADTTFSHDSLANLTGVDQPSGETQTSTYWSAASNTNDPLRKYRMESTTDAQGSDQFYTYDDHGNLTSVKDDATSPRNQQTLTYNSDGTLATATDGEGHQTTFSYTSGNLTQVTPPSVTSPGILGSTQYTYDTLGRVYTTTDGRGDTTTFTYDGLDRITNVAAQDGSSIAFTYDGNGNLTERTSSAGPVTDYTYDKLNRMTMDDLPGSAYNQYGYDKNGNLTSSIDQSGTVTYGYDNADRVTSIVSPATGGGTDTVSYSYADPTSSNAFTTRTETLPSGDTQQVKQDLSGKITDILLKNSSNTSLLERAYAYTVGSTQQDLVHTLTDQAGNTTTYTYADSTEDVGRLLKAHIADSSNALVREYRYSYDKAGNRTKREVQTPSGTTTTTYAYNAANQLCWAYTGTSTNACSSTPSGAATFSYDTAGDQLTGNNTLTWDAFGRLASIDSTSIGNLEKTNDALSAFGSATQQDNVYGLDRTVDGSTVTSIVHDPQTNLAVSQITGSTKRWYTQDNIGTTIGLTDSTGALARTYANGPDGDVTGTSGSAPDAALQFAGGQSVGSTGLYHFGARYYDPGIARWTQQDPLRNSTDLLEANRYGYAGGDPINSTDPTGMTAVNPCGANAWKILVSQSHITAAAAKQKAAHLCAQIRNPKGNVHGAAVVSATCLIGGFIPGAAIPMRIACTASTVIGLAKILINW